MQTRLQGTAWMTQTGSKHKATECYDVYGNDGQDKLTSMLDTCLSIVAISSHMPVYRLLRALSDLAGTVCMYGGLLIGCSRHRLCWMVIALPTNRLGHNLNTFCTNEDAC